MIFNTLWKQNSHFQYYQISSSQQATSAVLYLQRQEKTAWIFPKVILIYLAWIPVSNLPKYNQMYFLNFIMFWFLKNLPSKLISLWDKSYYFPSKSDRRESRILSEKEKPSDLKAWLMLMTCSPSSAGWKAHSLNTKEDASSFFSNLPPNLVPHSPILAPWKESCA